MKKIKIRITFKTIISLLCLSLAIIIFFKFAVPLVFGMVNIILALTKLYNLVDTNIKFIGGFLFLFVFYKIFEITCGIVSMLWNFAFDLIKDKEKVNR